MKTQIIELFGSIFEGAEKARWAIAHQRIRRVCKAAQMIGYIYESNESTYKHLYSLIQGEVTLEKVVDAINTIIEDGRPTIDKTDRITMDGLRDYCRMSEEAFKQAFIAVEGYEYSE